MHLLLCVKAGRERDKLPYIDEADDESHERGIEMSRSFALRIQTGWQRAGRHPTEGKKSEHDLKHERSIYMSRQAATRGLRTRAPKLVWFTLKVSLGLRLRFVEAPQQLPEVVGWSPTTAPILNLTTPLLSPPRS